MNAAKEITNVENLPIARPDPMMILQAAVERGVDADQLGKLMDLQERYQANQARIAFSSAMSDFQAHCPTILKSKKADRYSYAPLDEILRTIRPHLDTCGLSIRFSTLTTGLIITALCTISHRDGHSEQSEFAAPVDSNMKVNDTQKMGSANSYAKRYALMNALNLVASDEDDDGYRAGVEFIAKEQADLLRADIEKLKINLPKYLECIPAKSLDEIPAAKLSKALSLVERKRSAA